MSSISRIALAGLLALSANAHAVGQLPTPVLTDVRISADAVVNSLNEYTYSYTISNGTGSTGEITDIELDVTALAGANEMAGRSFGLTVPLAGRRVDFSLLQARRIDLNRSLPNPGFFEFNTIVPFGQDAPPGWNGGIGMGGYASFGTSGATPGIMPGASLSGFRLQSFGVPTIRSVRFVPFWMHLVESHETVTAEDQAAAAQVEASIAFEAATLGASGVGYGTFAHWDQLRDDIARAVGLNWLDPTLAKTLSDQLAFARAALDERDRFTATLRLGTVLNTINNSTPAQRTSEGYALVALNVQSLIDFTGDNEVEPRITISPKTGELLVGQTATFTATVIDRGNGSRPIPNRQVRFFVTSGPDAGNEFQTVTDEQGLARYTYIGRGAGTDTVLAVLFFGREGSIDDSALFQWSGGTDLVVPVFIPPVLKTESGRTVFVTEWTQNIGTIPTPETVTRYFVSLTETFDPSTALFVGERTVPALKPDETSQVREQAFTIPGGLPLSTYFLAACADAGMVTVELDENNNCSFVKLAGREVQIVPVEVPSQALRCDTASPSVRELWPPNHHLVGVTIQGVSGTTPGEPVTIQITGITQDEPVNGLGDGDTAPDAFGVGSSIALLRAERSGLRNGRVYQVSFTATASGGTCTGSVAVGVPHDQRNGRPAIDDGQNYDSTVP